jgi:hypothetical protein
MFRPVWPSLNTLKIAVETSITVVCSFEDERLGDMGLDGIIFKLTLNKKGVRYVDWD